MAFMLLIYGLELVPVKWPRLGELLSLGPVCHQFGIPNESSISVGFQQSRDISELVVWVAFLLQMGV